MLGDGGGEGLLEELDARLVVGVAAPLALGQALAKQPALDAPALRRLVRALGHLQQPLAIGALPGRSACLAAVPERGDQGVGPLDRTLLLADLLDDHRQLLADEAPVGRALRLDGGDVLAEALADPTAAREPLERGGSGAERSGAAGQCTFMPCGLS